MRTEELRMFELMDEIADICSKKGAEYYLIGNELLYSYIGKRAISCTGDICMTFRDYKIIEPELEKNKGRTIESIKNNPDFPGMYYRYVDCNSLMIQPEFHRVRKEHGIAVNIHILRKDNPDSIKLCEYENIMESNIEGCSRRISSSSRKHFISQKKKDSFEKWLNDHLNDAALTDISDRSILKIPGVGTFVFENGYWDKPKTIVINKKKYNTVSSPEVLLSQWYGDNFTHRNYRSCFENFRTIADTEISYRELDESYWERFNSDRDFWKRRSEFLNFYYDEWVNLNVELRNRQNQLYFQKSRFLLWKKYSFEKKKLRELLDSGRYDELKLLFMDMDDHMKLHMPYGQVPFFDKDVWDIYMEVLKQQGEIDRIEMYLKALEDYPVGELDEKELKEYYGTDPEEKITIRQCI